MGAVCGEKAVGINIVALALVDDGYTKIIHLTEKDEGIKAARVSLGVLGAISQVMFAMEKIFKRLVTLKVKEDLDLENSERESGPNWLSTSDGEECCREQGNRGFPVVGYNQLMQSSSGCQINAHNKENDLCLWKAKELKSNDIICNWDMEVKGGFYYHTSIAIPLSRIMEAKQLRDMDPSALCNYRGVPHWGKNQVYTFKGAAKQTMNLGKLLEVKKQLDPKGYFSSEWSDGVLGSVKGYKYGEMGVL
ncbi:L-gulonolactone oxidase 3-like [Cryptomeria japonica]|uniref:L-gulonolactone oxidase 3-like n=1 Tax=Cryptomeria japonica TaxID=3369 RepID=UPI0027DA2402|nr:L-gulonolactone oxidase 3-like [Cryptomeria japonica]